MRYGDAGLAVAAAAASSSDCDGDDYTDRAESLDASQEVYQVSVQLYYPQRKLLSDKTGAIYYVDYRHITDESERQRVRRLKTIIAGHEIIGRAGPTPVSCLELFMLPASPPSSIKNAYSATTAAVSAALCKIRDTPVALLLRTSRDVDAAAAAAEKAEASGVKESKKKAAGGQTAAQIAASFKAPEAAADSGGSAALHSGDIRPLKQGVGKHVAPNVRACKAAVAAELHLVESALQHRFTRLAGGAQRVGCVDRECSAVV